MEYVARVEVDAPAEAVWAVLADVERWPEWTASMSRVQRLDSGSFGVGSRVRVQQPRLPAITYTVSSYRAGEAFSWQTSSPGARTVADHAIERRADGGSTVTLRFGQTGPLGELLARLLRGTVQRYVDMEAAGLKRRSEGSTA